MNSLVKKSFKLIGLEVSRSKRINHNSNDIAFLHIGKNAGTQVMHIARQLKQYGVHIKKYGHEVKLNNLPTNTKYFFSIRDPAKRFMSGFYSRKRKGQPRIYSEWSLHEKIAFERFEHANDLAENLFEEGKKGVSARQAIKSIIHTGMQQIDWFQRCAYLEIRPPLTIIRQEHFKQDIQRLLDLLDVELELSGLLTEDKVSAHKNNYNDIPSLSEKAIANLEKWYIQDYMFYKMCEAWLEENNHLT